MDNLYPQNKIIVNACHVFGRHEIRGSLIAHLSDYLEVLSFHYLSFIVFGSFLMKPCLLTVHIYYSVQFL